MFDPYIAEAMTSAVADAAVGLTVQASLPAWKQLLARSKPDPKILRENSLWEEVKLSSKLSKIIVDYIDSPQCHGLLQILAYVMLADDAGLRYEYQASQLGDAFSTELLAAINDDSQSSRQFAARLWVTLTDSVRLQLSATKVDDFYPANRLLAMGLTDRTTTLSVDRVNRGSDNSEGEVKQQRSKLEIASIVPERNALSSSLQRSSEAILLAQRIREIFKTSYGHIIMPHAREDYRVRLEDLYVRRHMAPISDQDLKNLHITFQTDTQGAARFFAEEEMNDRRYVLIGNPGAGKSTFVRHLMYAACAGESATAKLVPLMVELKSYPVTRAKPFSQVIAERLQYLEQIDVNQSTISDLLVLGYGLVVFDGLDEITNLSRRREAVHAIEAFCRRFPLARVVVTSRPEGYSGAPLNPLMFSAYRLPDFSEEQVADYVRRWFSLTQDASGMGAFSVAEGFLHDSGLHAADLRTNPLMLSLLCMVYKYVGYIPENRPEIYEQCTELLFDRWDSARYVRNDIEPDRKVRPYLVQELAYYFLKHQAAQGGIEERMLLLVLQEYLRRNVVADIEIARTRARDFLDYCAGRAWVITMIGTSPKGQRVFAFTHRTFMEYFVACYLVRQHTNVREFVHALQGYITQGSSDVIPQIAIQYYNDTHADGIDDCLSVFLFDSPNIVNKVQYEYLPFVIRCTQSMRPSPRVMKKIFYAAIGCYLSTREISLFEALDVSESDHAASLESFAQDVLTEKSSSDDTSLGARIGCCLLLLAQRTPRFDSLVLALCDSLQADLSGCKRSFPDALTILVRRRKLAISVFSAACSAEQLIQTTRFAHMKSITESGALLQEMAAFRKSRALMDPPEDDQIDMNRTSDVALLSEQFGQGSMLWELITYLFASPDILLPVQSQTMTSLIDLVHNYDTDDIKVMHEIMSDCVEFHAFMLVVFMASWELGYDLASAISSCTGRKVSTRYLSMLQESRDDRTSIDRGCLIHLRHYGISGEWINFVKSWTKGDRSILRDNII